jgi:TIR domain
VTNSDSENQPIPPKKVFISYAHPAEPDEKRELLGRLLALANSLRSNGIDAYIDQYEVSPPEGWPKWMLDRVEDSDFVLVVCNEEYNRRFRGNEAYGKGKGVTWEGGAIIQELYDAQGQNSKFIPIILSPEDSKFIPSFLRGVTRYRLTDFNLDDNNYSKLYRHLTGQTATLVPALGPIVKLPKQERKTDFEDFKPPKVFISYAHPLQLDEKRELLDRVLTLSDRLRLDGIDCYIDQYLEEIPENWEEWMQERVKQADFVLIVCTQEYDSRFRSRKTDSEETAWQGCVVIERLYRENKKFIPIAFDREDSSYITAPLKDGRVVYYDLHIENSKDYESLYRYFTQQPESEKKQLEKLPPVPEQYPRQTFGADKIHSNIPSRSGFPFVGRNREIRRLLKKIFSRQVIHNIHGIGGIGKTSLAIEVANQCLDARNSGTSNSNVPMFDAFLFISFKDTTYPQFNTFSRPKDRAKTPSDIYRIIGEELEEKILKLPKEEQLLASCETLSKYRTLMIVDNTEILSREDREEVNEFLKNVPQSTKVIIATKEPLGTIGITLRGLEERELSEIVTEESELRGIELTAEQINKIYTRVGGHILIAKDVLNQISGGNDLEEILDSEASGISASVEKCIAKQIESLDDLQHKLFMAAVMLPDLPSQDLLLKVTGFTKIREKESDRDLALSELERLCLIVKQEDNCYSIEPTTRGYARSKLLPNLSPDIYSGMKERKLEYYQELTKQHGGEDWGKWKEQYAPLKREWQNIESVLKQYRDRGDWTNLFKMWQNVDRYVDLSGYWRERLEWWTVIEQNTDNPRIKAKALAEKAWSKILMGNTDDDYIIARKWLEVAQEDYRFDEDDLIKADIANYSVTAWEIENKGISRERLQKELYLIDNNNIEINTRTGNRYRARNSYSRAKIEEDLSVAEQQFREVIELCGEIDWLRYRNYAQNDLADILIKTDRLEEAEDLLKKGLRFATEMEEERRMGLWYFSFAKFYQRKIDLFEPVSPTDIRRSEYITNRKSSLDEAKTRFEKWDMKPELGKIKAFEQENGI